MKSSLTCIIVDDEPSSSELLIDSLACVRPAVKVAGIFDNWEAALPVLRNTKYDLLFLDISMPGKTGLELLEMLPGRTFEVIFITAHSEHALSAFEFAPSGYVLKPIDDSKLSLAIDNAIERIEYKRLAKQPHANTQPKIGIPDKKGTEYVNIEDIICLEAMNGCTKVVTKSAEIISSYTLGKFKIVLEPHNFFQINRSFIVNTNCVRRYTIEGDVILSNGMQVPVSKNCKADFLLIFSKVSKSNF